MNKNYFVVGLDNTVCNSIFNRITKSENNIFVKASLSQTKKIQKEKGQR